MMYKLKEVDERFKNMHSQMDEISNIFFKQTIAKRKRKLPDLTPHIVFVDAFPIMKNMIRRYIHVSLRLRKAKSRGKF